MREILLICNEKMVIIIMEMQICIWYTVLELVCLQKGGSEFEVNND